MANAWIEHVKRFQQAHGCSYNDALKGASASYRSMKGSGYMQELHSALTTKEARKLSNRGPNMGRSANVDYGYAGLGGSGVGRRNKYTKWVDALGAKDLIDAGFSKGTSTINGSGVGRRNKYTKWVDALGAKDLIDAGFSKGTSTINGSGVKQQGISALKMANAMYGNQAMTQLKKHRRKLSGMALYPAGM